jgi:hypothetical protein
MYRRSHAESIRDRFQSQIDFADTARLATAELPGMLHMMSPESDM